MIWALLAILGVPIWLIVGVLTTIWLSRRSFRRQPGVFAVVVRDEGAEKWPRRTGYARLVRDVLVVNRGAALLRTDIRPIDAVTAITTETTPRRHEDWVCRLIDFDGGSRCEISLAAGDAAALDAVASTRPQERTSGSS